MATRPAYVWTGSDWDDIGDKRLGASVTAINSELSALDTALGSKLDLAGGKILQIVRATDTTQRSTTSTTFVDVTGMSVTITPQKNNSAIIIIAHARTSFFSNTTDDVRGGFQITDSSNNAISGAESQNLGSNNLSGSGTRDFRPNFFILGYATPAVATAVTYKLRFRIIASGSTTVLDNNVNTGQMYAIEVSA
jgi:hypothetical protein